MYGLDPVALFCWRTSADDKEFDLSFKIARANTLSTLKYETFGHLAEARVATQWPYLPI